MSHGRGSWVTLTSRAATRLILTLSARETQRAQAATATLGHEAQLTPRWVSPPTRRGRRYLR